MATVEKLFKRTWLNEDQGTAYVVIDAEKSDNSKYVDVCFEIKDCSRQISLDFYYHDEEERQAKIAKVDRFIAHLNELKDFIVRNPAPTQEEVDAVNKAEKKKKKIKTIPFVPPAE